MHLRVFVHWAVAASWIASVTAATFAADPGYSPSPPASGPVIKTDLGYLVPYKLTIPGTEISFEMAPIPGGKFKLGSPATEKDRKPDEGPQVEIEFPPFWMGKHEVTWGEYKLFMELYQQFTDLKTLRATLLEPAADVKGRDKLLRERDALRTALADPRFAALKKHLEQSPENADAITTPTKLYDPSTTFESGDDPRQPAVTMTQYAARQYTKWLSRSTGHTYRLPSEAEWEYACRAGSATAYSFGDDASKLGEYAWFYDNSEEKTHKVGQKKGNAWGLFDMHGNVAEWVLDQHHSDGYARLTGKTVKAADAIAWPKVAFPRVVRGGSFDDEADALRSAARRGSHDLDWKSEDPNRPLSPWWFTSPPANGVGFRLVRVIQPLSADEKKRAWEIDEPSVQDDVKGRLEQARGVLGVVDQSLPEVLKQLEAFKKLHEVAEKK
jgi:formylglycine-generating enzyme required for sulfatase activity